VAGGKPIAVSGRFFEKSLALGLPANRQVRKLAETTLFKKVPAPSMGLHAARPYIAKLDCILLVEGSSILFLPHQSGLPLPLRSRVRAYGRTSLALGRQSKRLILALDADAAGIRAGLRSAYMALQEGLRLRCRSSRRQGSS